MKYNFFKYLRKIHKLQNFQIIIQRPDVITKRKTKKAAINNAENFLKK